MPTSEALIQELKAGKCRCGRRKRRGETFCEGCYFSLPVLLRNLLYRRMGDGYEESYDLAVRWLDDNKTAGGGA